MNAHYLKKVKNMIEVWNKKMTREKIEEIAQLRLKGLYIKEIAQIMDIHPTTISHYFREIEESMRKGLKKEIHEDQTILDPFTEYLNEIKRHLDKYGNTIVTRIRLENYTLNEIMEALKQDGYDMDEPVKAKNYEGHKRYDYWIIEGGKYGKGRVIQ